MSRTGADSVLRGLEILEALAGLEQPAPLITIADRAGLNESAAYRTLHRLQTQGYVDHVPRLGYRLGSRSIALAVLVGPEPPLLRVAQRSLTRLVAATGQSAAMHLRSGAFRVLTVGVPAPSHPLRDDVVLGERSPLVTGSAGLVILAHLPEKEVDELLASVPDDQTPSDVALERIRTDGFLLGRRESNTDLVGISAPLLEPTSRAPIGSVTIAGPGKQTTAAKLRELAPVLTKATIELAPQLARLLGPNTSRERRGLDVTVRWHDPDS